MSYQVIYNIVYYVDCGLWAVGCGLWGVSVCWWWLGGIGEACWLPYFLLPLLLAIWLAEKPEKGKRRPDGRTATTPENAAARPSGHP